VARVLEGGCPSVSEAWGGTRRRSQHTFAVALPFPLPSQLFPSTHFYEGTLKAAAGLNERTWAGSALRLHPYSCVHVDGVETKDGHSWKNETEVGVACLQQCVRSFSFEPWMPLGHRWSRWRRLSLDW
jgi:hypothetical protein